jgi:integrase
MRESENATASTIRRRLAALSSLYKHLVRDGHAARNPVGEVEGPAINRDEGLTLAFSKAQDAQSARRSAIARSCRSVFRSACGAPKSRRSRSATCTRTAAMSRCASHARAGAATPSRSTRRPPRLRAYLEAAGHGADADRPLFRPLRDNGKRQDERRGMGPDAIDRVVRKYAGELGLDCRYSAHSMRATFITTAIENGAQLEDVQKAAGHRDPSTTKLYDRRGYNPEKAASLFATY